MDPFRGSRFIDNKENGTNWTQCMAFFKKNFEDKTIEVRSIDYFTFFAKYSRIFSSDDIRLRLSLCMAHF